LVLNAHFDPKMVLLRGIQLEYGIRNKGGLRPVEARRRKAKGHENRGFLILDRYAAG
jgi:hypothetical protein